MQDGHGLPRFDIPADEQIILFRGQYIAKREGLKMMALPEDLSYAFCNES